MKYFLSQSVSIFVLLFLSAAWTAFADVSDTSAGKPNVPFEAIIADMAKAAANIHDATYIFHKQEYADGKQQPAERIRVKYRAPNDIYMLWVGSVHAGREVLFRSGWNRGRLRVRPGSWLPTLNLDPNGYLAMRGNRHNIYQLPFPAIVANFVHSARLIAADPALEAEVSDLGEQRHYGEMAHCYRLKLPKARQPLLYAALVELCVSRRTGLPLTITAWDRENGQLRRVEKYAYEDVQPNVGLTDRDFSADNPAYGF